MADIRRYGDGDWGDVWRILEPVFRAGETYAYSPDIGEEDARDVWVVRPLSTYVLHEAGDVLGTYYLKPNQPGLGNHVCNCGYVVSEGARGRGFASQMCVHSQSEARRLGFLAMQYNLVASTNEGAVRLWQRHGFEVVGTLPQAFRNARLGLVDAHVMYKRLVAESS